MAELRITLIGGLAVERDGTVLPTGEVGSRKARTVLKVLAAQRGRLVPMDRLVEVLWVGRPPADAAANVATLVSRLRASLGAGVIDGGRGGYRLVTGAAVIVDLDEATALVAEAETRLAAAQPGVRRRGRRRRPRVAGIRGGASRRAGRRLGGSGGAGGRAPAAARQGGGVAGGGGDGGPPSGVGEGSRCGRRRPT